MDDETREALGYNKPNFLLKTFVRGAVYFTSLVQEHMLPPRDLGDESKFRTSKFPGGCPRFSLIPVETYPKGYQTCNLGPAMV